MRAGSRPGPQDGYMLVEMVAALALTGLLLTFAMPTLSQGTSAPRFLALATASATMLRDARTQSIASAKPVSAGFDARARRLHSGSRFLAIPADVDVSLVAGGLCPSDKAAGASIVFRPNGTNCGGVLRFAHGGRILRVRVDWVDGRIDVAQGG